MSTGADFIADCLESLEVTTVFGLVGIPVINVAEAAIARGIKFVAFRNEQAAVYAATAYGYLTGRPGVALVVGGPGVVHAMAGIENARANCFPLLLLAGSAHLYQRHKGAFQELDQVSLVTPHTKFAAQPTSVDAVPFLIEKAYRTAYYGRPGPSYVDLPADIIEAVIKKNEEEKTPLPLIRPPGDAPRAFGDPARIKHAAELLVSAKSPLMIIGKGAAYGRAENAIRTLESKAAGDRLPFLPTPMGKGVISDAHPMNISAARSAALETADVVLLLGARLNWILHFGEAPKFASNVTFIQVDIAAEEIGNGGSTTEYGIVGDVAGVTEQLTEALLAQGWPDRATGVNEKVAASRDKNVTKAAAGEKQAMSAVPLKYQAVYKCIRDVLEEGEQQRKIVYASEGANAMDISRSSFTLTEPRTRLDAGTNATMGLGLGYAIAAKAHDPSSTVIAIEGDSAFGFSGMEIETSVRSRLPLIVYIMNNSGLYQGCDPALYEGLGLTKKGEEKEKEKPPSLPPSPTATPLPSTALQLETEYHLLAESFGARGFLAHTLDQVRDATRSALIAAETECRTSVINVIIESGKEKKLEFGWMASTKKK